MIKNEPLVLESHYFKRIISKTFRSFSYLFLWIAALYTSYHFLVTPENLRGILLADLVLIFLWLITRMLFQYTHVQPAVHIFNEQLIISNGHRSLEILYAEITKVTPHFFNGTFSLKLKDGRVWTSDTGCKQTYEILIALREFNSSLITKMDFEKLYRRICFIDYNKQRFADFLADRSFFRIYALTILLVAVPAVFSIPLFIKQVNLFAPDSSIKNLLVFGIATTAYFYFFAIGCILYLVSEAVINYKAYFRIKNSLKVIHFVDYKSEKKAYALAYASFLLVSMLFSFTCNRLNLFSYLSKTASADILLLNVKAGQSYVMDIRYNCLNCKYRIKKGDAVYIIRDDDHFGRVIALPGEAIMQSSRLTASTSSNTPTNFVPPDKIAVEKISADGNSKIEIIEAKHAIAVIRKNLKDFLKH